MNPSSHLRSSLIAVAAIALLSAASAFAQDKVPGHPRVNEVDQRLDNQQQRIDKGVADGQITAAQAARDEKHDANIAERESADEAKNGGHLTRGEQHRLNRSLNHNSHRIHRQRHNG